jgi:outer membrane protein OmpA-like peptidoglycan-associated protein
MMRKYFTIMAMLFFCGLSAQGKKVETIYFDFDKYTIDKEQEGTILDFITKTDTSSIESVQIYGYCDDRGNNDYNYKLSEERVNTVRDVLLLKGFNKNKIVIIEGKGRVILTADPLTDVAEIRSKNRRVDLLIVRKNSFGKGIYNSFQNKHAVGDRIYLENIFFPLGSSKLTAQTRTELDKIATLLNKKKTIEFEIRGHVCCTPSYFNDAIDRDTNERKLSVNRAKIVFKYLMSKDVNSLRMKYIGCGNKFPLGKGEEFDRRVEFLITKI